MPGAHSGLRLVQTGMRTLAFEAVGLAGPLGRIAGGLLQLGGGSTLVLGAAAGLGLVGAAWKAAAAEADLASSNVEAAAARMHAAIAKALGEGFGPERRAATQAAIDEKQALLNNLLMTPARIDSTLVPGAPPGQMGVPGVRMTPAETRKKQIDDAKTALGQLITLLAAIDRESEKAAETGLRDLRLELSGINAEIRTLVAGGRPGLPSFFQETLQSLRVPNFQTIMLRSQAAAGSATAMQAQRDALVRSSFLGVDFFGGGPSGGAAFGRARPEKDKIDAARIAAESIAVMGAFRQGGAGGVLSATGSLFGELGAAKSAGGLGLTGFGPVGIGLQVAGGVFSLLDNSAERRHKEMMAELRKIAQRPLIEGTTRQPIFIGSRTPEVVYEAQRRADRDAIDRGVGGGL